MGSAKEKELLKAVIHVTLKPGVLDPQGRAVFQALQHLGFSEVEDVRVGKRIVVSLNRKGGGPTRERLEEMCRSLLANPVIEEFQVEMGEE